MRVCDHEFNESIIGKRFEGSAGEILKIVSISDSNCVWFLNERELCVDGINYGMCHYEIIDDDPRMKLRDHPFNETLIGRRVTARCDGVDNGKAATITAIDYEGRHKVEGRDEDRIVRYDTVYLQVDGAEYGSSWFHPFMENKFIEGAL